MDKAAEIAYSKLNMLVQQAIRLYLCYMVRGGGIVMDLESVYLPVLQRFYRGMYSTDYQMANHIYYLLLKYLLQRILTPLDPQQGILAVYGRCRE